MNSLLGAHRFRNNISKICRETLHKEAPRSSQGVGLARESRLPERDVVADAVHVDVSHVTSGRFLSLQTYAHQTFK